MNRRSCLLLLAAAMAAPAAAQETFEATNIANPLHPLQHAWQEWKGMCLMSDGRVVDSFQDGASHSEGQGYGLVLAAMFADHASCRAIITWTERHLAVRDDALLAWRWRPQATPQVEDVNNASDGDIFYAWGLLMAGDLLGNADWRIRAKEIAHDLDRLCLIDHPDGSGDVVLLPAAQGFVRDDGVLINPSYYMPLAMFHIAEATETPRLAASARNGITLIDTLGIAGPVPDWVLLFGSQILPAPEGFSTLAGYEAVRVPLFALWSGNAVSPAVLSYVRVTLERGGGSTPTRIDPATGEVSERSSHSGYAAVTHLGACASAGEVGSLMPRFDSDQPYYPATLHLMSLLVQITTYPRCVPL